MLLWAALAGGTQPYETYEGKVASSEPVAQFRFNDASGSATIEDAVGTHTYTATNTGITLGEEGPFGGSKSGAFAGAAYATLPSSPLKEATAFTAEAWVDWKGGSSYKQPIFDFGSGATSYMYLTPASALSKHELLFEIISGTTKFQTTATELKSKAWEYLAVTESSGTLTLYLNGAEVGHTSSVTLTPASLGSTTDNYLGQSVVEKEPLFEGSLSNVAFYTKALTATQIQEHYDAAEFPVNTVTPTISGTAKDGSTLTASKGTWTGLAPITYAYQWMLCNASGEGCASIPSATETKYVLGHEDVGGTLRVAVMGANSAGNSTATSAQTAVIAALAPSNTALPTISGEAKSGQLLSVSTGTWKGTPPISYTYQWQKCNSSGGGCANITGATASSYRILNSQVGDTLRAIVTASNAAGSAKADSAVTAVIVAGPPANTELPAISGEAKEGKTLSASTGKWAGTEPFSYTYQWERCNAAGEGCANVSGATSSSYILGQSDVGDTLRVIVTAKDSVGSTEATSEPSAVVIGSPLNTSAPVISGTARDGQTLSASTGAWSGYPALSYSYQWESCNLDGEECDDIEGATSQTYALGSGDLETTVRVVVTATNLLGSGQSTSAATSVVEAGAPSELEPPAISGDPYEGETLHGEAGQWGGTEDEVAYQWELCNSTSGECVDIAGATEADYQPTEGDVGKTLRLRVGVSNALGAVTAISPATETIGAVSKLMNTLAPSIAGTPQNGRVLSANAGSWLGVTSIGYEYQWQKCNIYGAACENIAGATSSSYTLGTESVGSTIRVRVHASEEEGAVYESSAATQPIAASTAPVVEAPPAVSGTGLVGDKVTATAGSWSGAPVSYSYQWERCNEYGESCSSISGATSSTYTLTESDATHTVRVFVTATGEGSSSTKAASFPLAASKTTLANVAAPSITGSDEIARGLSADKGIWTGEGALTYTYKWERCNEKGESCSTISGATESSYTPVAADVGKTLRVVVTAEGAAGKESVNSAVTPVIDSESLAPTNLLVPTIEGNLTPGETLTAQTGTWVSSETITYTYQWEKCNEEGEECTSITGATSSTYTLVEGDINSTLRVTVTGRNTLGSANAESEPTEVVGAAGPPKDTSVPTINGTAKQGEHLVAGNGTWSGSRPLSYYYRWERCNSSGESCTLIEGATKPSYTVASGDVGSTLRVKVTASNTLGSAGAVSAQTSVVAGSEANATSAIELAEKTDPSVLQPAQTYTVEGREVKPALSDTGEQLTTITSLTSSSISKETPGEFAVNTPDGELSFAPVNSAPNATTLPTIVNGAAAVYAGTSSATDTIVRPDALGATTLLQLRSAEAPTSYSWEVGLGPSQYLEKLPNGDIAVVEVPSSSPLEGSLGEELSLESSEATAEHEGSGESGEAAENTLEEEISGESALEKLAAAPTASTPSVEPKSGELHPQETKAQYETAKSTVTYSEEHAGATTLMVIESPKAMDAKGSTVSSSLSFEEETVTVTISPSGGTTFPVTAETNIAAMSDTASAAKGSKVRYGLSDPHPTTFAVEKEGKLVSDYDEHLKSGPLHTEIARDAIPYNKTSPEALKGWLEAVHTAGLQPYITLDGTCEVGHPCEKATIGRYAYYAERLIGGVLKLHREHPSTVPLVTLWGAWNEPDLDNSGRYNPLDHKPHLAALFWKKGRAILKQKGCKHCTMVAGEFAKDDGYIEKYEAVFRPHDRAYNPAYWSLKPHAWGFHDYEDLEDYYYNPHNSYAEAFLKHIRKLGKSRVWFSEQGVELQNGKKPTKLEDDSSQSEDAKRQRIAANDFLNLAKVHLGHELDSVEVVDYYLYRGPSKKEKEEKNNEHLLDSALLPGEGVTEEENHPAPDPRMAYCVLALGKKNGCPATSKTKTAVAKTVTSSGGTVTLNVNPEGLPTKYFVEYGTTTAYGQTTTATATTNEAGEQSETVTLSGLEACTTYHYQAEAENEVNEEEKEPGLGGDQAFTTTGCPPVVETGPAYQLAPEECSEEGINFKLTGTINPNGLLTAYYFEYSDYRIEGIHSRLLAEGDTSMESAGSGSKPIEVSAIVHFPDPSFVCADLSFRLVGTNASGTSYGGYREEFFSF
jgi:hypothetical protein